MRFAILDETGQEVTWPDYQRMDAGAILISPASFLLGGFAVENADGSLTPARIFDEPGPVVPGDEIYAPKFFKGELNGT